MRTLKRKKTADHCLKLEGLSKVFTGLIAVDKVDLVVEHGERRAIIGPNGAGKTTLFNLLSGELKSTAGRIIYCGDDVTCLPAHRRAYLGISRTFQITSLFPNLTVIENILMACQAMEKTKFMMFRSQASYGHLMEKSEKLLNDFDLMMERNNFIKNISYGNQRKIEVAMALAGNPKLLLLDEPTAGLSSIETKSLTRMLKKLDPAMTVILIEHDMNMAFDYCENISVLHFGKLLADGTRDEIRNNLKVQQIYLGEANQNA